MQPSTRIQGRQLQMAATIPAYTYVLQGSMVTYESPPIMVGWFFHTVRNKALVVRVQMRSRRSSLVFWGH